MLVTEILSLVHISLLFLKKKELVTMSTHYYVYSFILASQVLSQVLGKSDRMRVVTMTIKCDHCFSEAKSRMEGGVRGMPKGS